MRRALLALIFVWLFLPGFYWLTGGPGWWQAQVLCASLLVPMTVFALWAARYRPAFLDRRMKFREQETTQRQLLRWANPVYLVAQVLPGLDRRFGWSEVPDVVCGVALALTALGYLVVLAVFVANPWAGRTVETVGDQQVVSTGPYGIVRHPMYVGVLLMFLAMPVGLGSWWASLPALAMIPVLVIRIVDEERVLVRELPGYDAYRQKVRHRLLPGIW
jgi:protein-S-isoprenylcysteine O-methyltransferase Ste14